MKLDSKLFDNIRIRPRKAEEPHVSAPCCAWEGCSRPGLYRAPKGHRAAGEYHFFCLEHVRHYNTAFNFFAGMDSDQIEEALHKRPETPDFGLGAKAKAAARGGRAKPRDGQARRFNDPLNLFARAARAQSKAPARERVKPLNEQDRRAFETLGLAGQPKSDDIKKAYKNLVKVHHPDANGGDRSSEDRLRAIIAAYAHLKTTGFVSR